VGIDERDERLLVPPAERPDQLQLTHGQDRTAERT
jgi:hypothetical protein